MDKQKTCIWCGHELIISKFDFCNPKCQTEFIDYTLMKLKPVLTKCICPHCGITHKRAILWTGKTTPRVFCDICIEIDFVVDNYEDDEIIYH